MEQNIMWEIENIQFKNLKSKSYFYIEGWAFAKNQKELFLDVFVNNNKLEVLFKKKTRMDIYQIYEDYLNDACIGFTMTIPCEANVDRFQIQIYTQNEEESFVLNADQIKNITSIGEIEYSVEEFKYDVAKKEYNVTGWAKDIMGAQIVLTIQDAQEQEIVGEFQCDLDSSFKITFPSEENVEYKMKIQSVHDTKIFPLVSETLNSNIPTSKMVYTLKKGMRYLKRNGIQKTVKRVLFRKRDILRYNEWLEQHGPSLEELQVQRNTKFFYAPKISVIVATFNTKESYLQEMIDSLVNQSYENWELCIADGSTNDFVQEYVKEHYSKDSRIVFKRLKKNYGISGNMNAALEMVTGEYVGLFDHDDLITPNCLYEIVSSLQEIRHDAIYTDEDKLDDDSHLFLEPHFKPDFSIDQLCSHNYITHFFVVSMNLVKQVGGLREEYDGSQDHDFILRCTEKAKSVHHIPKILYHWRMHLASTAMNPESKMYCYTSGKKAVQAHYDRLHICAQSEMMKAPLYGMYRSHYQTPGNPLVSIVLVCETLNSNIHSTIESLYTKNAYQNFELWIVYKEKSESFKMNKDNIYLLEWKEAFNSSSMRNFAVEKSHGDYLLLMNEGIEAINETSITEMLGYVLRKDVGCVGPKILNKKGTIQHCGIVLDKKNIVNPVFIGIKEDDFGYMGRPLITCNYSAISSACLMVKRKDYAAVNGMDSNLTGAFADADFCLKLRTLNKVNVLNVYSLWLLNSTKKEKYVNQREVFMEKWGSLLEKGDPFHNVNFDLNITPYMVPYRGEF